MKNSCWLYSRLTSLDWTLLILAVFLEFCPLLDSFRIFALYLCYASLRRVYHLWIVRFFSFFRVSNVLLKANNKEQKAKTKTTISREARTVSKRENGKTVDKYRKRMEMQLSEKDALGSKFIQSFTLAVKF